MNMLNQPILILKKGGERNQEEEEIIRKFKEFEKSIDLVKATLGPRGFENKLNEGKSIKMSNHDASISKMIDFKNKFE